MFVYKNNMFNRVKKEINNNGNNGIALFIAILTASIAFAIGTGVLNITLKQIKLSSIGEKSTQAFFAADTGLECVLYWDDIRGSGAPDSIFATSTDSLPIPSAGSDFECAGTDISNDWTISSTPPISSTAATTTFTIKFGLDSEPCARIIVAKYKDSLGNVRTKVDSRGLNSCDNSDSRRVERGIKMLY